MKKQKIFITFFLIVILFSCKKTEPETTPFTKLIIGKYTLNIWNVYEKGNTYSRGIASFSGSLEVIDVSDSLISIRGRSNNTVNFIYFPKFNYQEKTERVPDGIELFYKKIDYYNVKSYISQDMGPAAKGITRLLLIINYTDANGTRYEVSGEKLGR